MARDRNGATLTGEELAASERAGRKRLAEDGCPQERRPDRRPQEQGEDQSTGIVSEDWETARVDPPDRR